MSFQLCGSRNLHDIHEQCCVTPSWDRRQKSVWEWGGAFLIWPSGDFFDGFVSPPSTFLLSEIKLLRIVCSLSLFFWFWSSLMSTFYDQQLRMNEMVWVQAVLAQSLKPNTYPRIYIKYFCCEIFWCSLLNYVSTEMVVEIHLSHCSRECVGGRWPDNREEKEKKKRSDCEKVQPHYDLSLSFWRRGLHH